MPFSVIILCVCAAWFSGPVAFGNFWNVLLGLVIEVLPFLLLGAILATGIASSKFSRSGLLHRLSKHRVGAILAGIGMGFALPVCECGTASIARQANREGAPVGLSIVFLLAAPVINPVTLLVTYLAFEGNWLIILGRTGLALIVAGIIGVLLGLYPHPAKLFIDERTDQPGKAHDLEVTHYHDHTEEEPIEKQPNLLTNKLQRSFVGFNHFVNQATGEFIEAVHIVLPGICLASVFQTCVSARFFLDLGQGPLLSAVALMVLAALMSVCSSTDAFVALSFSSLSLTGSLLAFLVFGPLINLKTIFLYRLFLRWWSIALIAACCFSLILVAALFINLWFS